MTGNNGDLVLLKPSIEFHAQFLSLVIEYREENKSRFSRSLDLIIHDFPAYIKHLDDMSLGINLYPGYDPQITYWLVQNGSILVGTSRLRPGSSKERELEAGHIGYDIRPSMRQKGYGSSILALTLTKAHELGMKNVTLTCESDNHGSSRTIEKNGGVLTGNFIHSKLKTKFLRYSIKLD